MVRCSVCATEYPDYRTECPCCSHPAPQSAPPPARLPPPPPSPALPKRAEESGPLPRSFQPPTRPPGPLGAPLAPPPPPVEPPPIAPPRPAPPEVQVRFSTEDLGAAPTIRGGGWRVRVLTPDASPAALPPLLGEGRPWEDGFDVEIQIAQERDGRIDPLGSGRVQWRLRPAEPNGEVPGRVVDSDLPDRGEWTIDADGRVRLRFAPTRDNALLFAAPTRVTQAEFDVCLVDAAGEPGHPLPNAEQAESGAPSFVLLWAPKFDLGVLKLPFFVVVDTPLQLEPEPSEYTAPPMPWGLGSHGSAYRQLFRDGGTLALSLQAVDEGAEGMPALRRAIEHARIVIGAATESPEEPRRLLKFTELGEPETGGVKLAVPPARTARSGPVAVALQADLPLHPDVRRELLRVVEACRPLERALAGAPQLESPLPVGEGRASFRHLATSFLGDAFEVLCAARQATLVTKRHAFRKTLEAMASFLESTAGVWERLGESVEAHREAFRGLETGFLPFYRDFLLWGQAHEALAPGWKALRSVAPRAPTELRLNAPAESVGETVRSAFLRTGLESVVRPALEQRIEPWRAQRQRAQVAAENAVAQRASAAAAQEAAEQALLEPLGQIERLADELAARLTRQAEHAVPATPELTAELAALGRQIPPALQAVPAAFARSERRWRARAAAELEQRAAEVERTLLAEAAQRAEASLQQLDDLLAGERLEPEAISRLTEEPAAGALAEPLEAHLAWLHEQAGRRAEAARGLLEKLTRLRERILPLLGEPTESAGALGARFTAIAEAVATEAERTRTVVAELSEHYPARLAEAAAGVGAQVQANADALAQALRAGSEDAAELLRAAVETLPPAPPGVDESFARHLDEFVRGAVTSALALVPTGSPVLFRALSALAQTLLEHVGTLLVELTARFGTRAAEVLTALFDAALHLRGGGGWIASALEPDALQGGLAELRKLSVNPEKFFAFPYVKERVVLSHLAETADHLRQNRQQPDRASEQFVEEALRTGYDYYYPNQLKQARALLHGLCQRALSRELLASAPCSRESLARAEFTAAALAQLPREFAAALARTAGADAKAEFQAPLAGVVSGERWSQAALSAAAEWCGWLSAWTLRLGGITLALAGWWHAPTRRAAAAALAVTPEGAEAARRLFVAGGRYPYAGAYARDLLALQAVHAAVLFGADPERLPAQSAADFVRGYP